MRRVIALLAVAVTVGACAGSLDKEGTKDMLVREGATPEQAECLVDRLAEEFDGDDRAIAQLSDGDPAIDPDIDAKLQALSVECGLTAQP